MSIPNGFKTQFRSAKYREVDDIFCDVTFSGAPSAPAALTATKNWGVKGFTQAAASSALCVLALDQVYSRMLAASCMPVGNVPAASTMHCPANETGGGVATITFAAAANGDYVTLNYPAALCATVSGVGLTNDAFTFSTPTVTMNIAAGAFTAPMVGARITITGARSTGNNGTFAIATVASATQITFSNPNAVAEVFNGAYAIVQQTIKLTALTNAQTAVDGQFVVGTGASANADTATAFANLINQAADAGVTTMGCSVLPSTLTAQAIGATVILKSTVPGVQITSHNQTKELIVTDVAHTVDVMRTMPPGLVVEFAVGVTAHLPASGDHFKIGLTLQASDT